MNRIEYHRAVKEFSGRLYRFVNKNLRNADDSHDIVQDTFEKLWIHRKKVEMEKSKSWLFTVAHHGMLNLIKTKNRMDYVEHYDGYEPYSTGEQRIELQEVVENCLELLSPVQRSVILLRDMEGYDYKEIGEILNLSESQVKVYLFRGRQKIKNELKDLTVLS